MGSCCCVAGQLQGSCCPEGGCGGCQAQGAPGPGPSRPCGFQRRALKDDRGHQAREPDCGGCRKRGARASSRAWARVGPCRGPCRRLHDRAFCVPDEIGSYLAQERAAQAARHRRPLMTPSIVQHDRSGGHRVNR
eukprot:Amastigsp_a3099_13.p2 type:complete len:135 gc:universal Amastigsp_a3099_13:415-11(-)